MIKIFKSGLIISFVFISSCTTTQSYKANDFNYVGTQRWSGELGIATNAKNFNALSKITNSSESDRNKANLYKKHFCNKDKSRINLTKKIVYSLPVMKKGLPMDEANEIRSEAIMKSKIFASKYFERKVKMIRKPGSGYPKPEVWQPMECKKEFPTYVISPLTGREILRQNKDSKNFEESNTFMQSNHDDIAYLVNNSIAKDQAHIDVVNCPTYFGTYIALGLLTYGIMFGLYDKIVADDHAELAPMEIEILYNNFSLLQGESEDNKPSVLLKDRTERWDDYIKNNTSLKEAYTNQDTVNIEVSLDLNSFCKESVSIHDLLSE